LRDPDVIIGSSPHLFTGSAALKLARKYQVPFILEIRDPWPQILTEIGNISPIHPVIVVMKIIERKLYKHADAIVGVWPGMGEYIAERGGKKEKFVWIPNGINPDSVGTISKPETKDRLTLVYAGSHGVANDLDIILDTAKLIREGGLGDKVLFKLIGDGPEKPRLKRRVEDERLPNILLLDRMSWKEIREHFQKADGFIMHIKPLMCFKYGNSPNKLFDYMSAGRPVLFSINSHYNIVERARAGFTVDPVNPHSMLEGIRKLIGAGIDERWAMGLRGRKYIEKHHDIRNLASRYEEVLIRTRDRYSA
jgi:glycosyltransferase involved in cell wall biosynthesis